MKNFVFQTVTLKAKKGHFFKGFFIQVHEADRKKQDCHKKSIGKFQVGRNFQMLLKAEMKFIICCWILILRLDSRWKFRQARQLLRKNQRN